MKKILIALFVVIVLLLAGVLALPFLVDLASYQDQYKPLIEDALNRLNAQIAATPDSADLYLARGELYARHEEWVMAEANYLRAAELAPGHPRLPLLRGALEIATSRPAEALAHLDAALKIEPRNAGALILRGRARTSRGHRDTAVDDFNAVVRDPDLDVGAYRNNPAGNQGWPLQAGFKQLSDEIFADGFDGAPPRQPRR